MGIPPPPPSRVYWLAPPSQLKEQEDLLRRLMFQVVGVTDTSRYKFWVSESSGWWTFADTQALWRKGGRTSPVATQAIAKQKAEAFIAAWTKALTDHAAKPSSPLAELTIVPPLRPVETLLAARPDRTGWDHWLYRAQPQLDNNASSKLDVVGTAIEIRVGDGGTITNVSWRFRALTGQSTSSPSQSLEIANDEDGNPRENRQIYVLDGDGVPQYYLSPYHIVNVEDEYALVPACAHSLVVELGVIARDDGSSDVTAVTMGGSGNYEFNWGFYTYDDPWLERGVQDLGSGDSSEVQDDHKARLTISTINVPSSAGVIMVNVRDRSTGAFKHHAQPLFGYPKIALTAPEPESEPVA